MQSLSSPITSRSTNSSPATQYLSGMDHGLSLLDDLNINIEPFPNDFECNVDEVIRHELSIGGSLDFNFTTGNVNVVTTTQNPSTTQTPPTAAAAAAAAAAATAAAAAATTTTTNNHGQPSFNDHSWVH